MDSNLRREIILENYQDPLNRGLVDEKGYLKVNTNSESCIDNLDFMMKIENNTIVDVRYDGEACAISTSASSIMSRALIGKSVDEAKKILINYISKQPNRINCALLPSKAIETMLEQLESKGE